MIGSALKFIRERLDSYLRSAPDLELENDGSTPERVVFLDGDRLEPLTIPKGTLAMLVANVQEERGFRDADRYQRRVVESQGKRVERHYPDIHLEFTVLFVASFKDYVHAWNQLSRVLFFIQEHPVFAAGPGSDVPERIGRLSSELCSQSFQEQNELWGALKTSMRPSILVRFRLITLRGQAMKEQPKPVEVIKTETLGSMDKTLKELESEFRKRRPLKPPP
jgi:hypothetical protein